MAKTQITHPIQGEFFARPIHKFPVIFTASNSKVLPVGPIEMLGPRLRGQRVHALVNVFWSMENPSVRQAAVGAYRRHGRVFPEHQIMFLCGTAEEVHLLEADGVPARLCSHNLFVDTAVFDVDPNASKQFDAIYVAVMSRYKRHLLCAEIPSVALVYYDAQTRGNAGYFAEVERGLPNATFVNEQASRLPLRPAHPRAAGLINNILASQRHVNLLPRQVAAFINRSRVGLCLSSEEGAMLASVEYALCGVPVVTTQNRGGRDRFLRPEFSRTAAAEPAAIARAVAELIEAAPPAGAIRAAVCQMISDERRILYDILLEIFAAEGIASELPDAWRKMPLGGLQPRWTVDSFISAI